MELARQARLATIQLGSGSSIEEYIWNASRWRLSCEEGRRVALTCLLWYSRRFNDDLERARRKHNSLEQSNHTAATS